MLVKLQSLWLRHYIKIILVGLVCRVVLEILEALLAACDVDNSGNKDGVGGLYHQLFCVLVDLLIGGGSIGHANAHLHKHSVYIVYARNELWDRGCMPIG